MEHISNISFASTYSRYLPAKKVRETKKRVRARFYRMQSSDSNDYWVNFTRDAFDSTALVERVRTRNASVRACLIYCTVGMVSVRVCSIRADARATLCSCPRVLADVIRRCAVGWCGLAEDARRSSINKRPGPAIFIPPRLYGLLTGGMQSPPVFPKVAAAAYPVRRCVSTARIRVRRLLTSAARSCTRPPDGHPGAGFLR